MASANSNEYTNQLDAAIKLAPGSLGALQLAPFSYTHSAGADNDFTLSAIKLPAGKVRIYPDLSRIVSSSMSTNADLHIGYAAYTDVNGNAVVANDHAFADNLDAGSAKDQAWVLPAVGYLELESQQGIVITVHVDTANIGNTNTIAGWCAFVHVSY